MLAACGFHASVAITDAATEPASDGRGDGPLADAADAAVDSATANGPMVLQQKTADSANSTQLSVTLNAATSGDWLVMIGAAVSGALDSVTGGGVTTWNLAARSLDNANVEIWYGRTDGSSSTVTINFAASSAIWMNVSEWSGLVMSGVLDGALATSGLLSPADAGTLATTHAHDLVIFAVGDYAPSTFGTPTQGPWSALNSVDVPSQYTQFAWYQVVSATGSFDPTVTETGGGWDAAIAAFKAQ